MPIWSPENFAEKDMVMPLKVSVGASADEPLVELVGVVVVVLLIGVVCALVPGLSVDTMGALVLVPAVVGELVLVLVLELPLVVVDEVVLVLLFELELELVPELLSHGSAESPPEP
jgi:hypothetical protein